MIQLRATSLADTHAIAAAMARVSRSGDLVVLGGDMGAGKTAFAQGFAVALGITEPVTSPTYTLVHSYDGGRLPLHHADIYRLSTQHEVADLALAELLESDGIVLVEWGDVVAGLLGDHLMVRLEPVEPDHQPAGASGDQSDDDAVSTERAITISGHGSQWARRWTGLVESLGEFAC